MIPLNDPWQQTLAQLRLQMTRATFEAWLLGSCLIDIENDAYVIEVASVMAVDWLTNRLKDIITRNLAGVVGKPVKVQFISREDSRAYSSFDDFADEETPEEPDLGFAAAYHDARNAIIQPSKVEVHTQYFRRKWRPLLGPLLSELIRELRQRCYLGKDNKAPRNTFGITYKSLAAALGVSERTVYRALERDETGNFKNEYLKYFIKDIRVLKKYDADKHKYINDKTQFVIYLDEPLTPEDQARLSNCQNVS